MNIVKYSIVAAMLFIAGHTYGQTPEKVVIDSKDYYQHGFNRTGPNTFDGNGKAIEKAQEARDSVTVTSVMKYFVLPDPNISPSYDPANALVFTNVNSTFAWTLKNSLGTTNSSTTPLVVVTWNSTGIDSVKVKETPNVGAACAGKETSIPVAIISKPTITFNQTGTPSDYKDGACYTQTQVNTGISYSFPMTVTSQSSQIKVDYSIVFTPISGSTETVTVTDAVVSVTLSSGTGTGTIPITLQNMGKEYGKYEVTITKVTDRIARKSNVVGDIVTAGNKFTYTVMKPAQTGPIYRIPNNY